MSPAPEYREPMHIRPLTGNLAWAQAAGIQLVSQRMEQLAWLRSFDFQMDLERWISESPVRNHLRGGTAQADMSQGLIEQWEEGLNAVLSKEAAAAIYSGADALHGAVMPALSPSDLPTQVGLLVLPRTIYAQDARGTKIGFSALSWSPCGISPNRLGVLVSAWTHRSAEADETVRRNRWQTVVEGMDTSTAPNYLLRSMDPIVFGQNYGLGVQPGVLASAHRLEAESTRSLDESDMHPESLVMRLIFSAWDLLRQGHLTLGAVPLPPRSAELYAQGHRDFPVVGVDVPERLRSSMITARRRQVVEGDGDRIRQAWRLDRPRMARVR